MTPSACFGGNRRAAFTLAEFTVAMAVSTMIFGALMIAVTSLSRTFDATEKYSRAQAAQVRLIDAIALDLRRATGVAITTSATSNPTAAGNTTAKFSYAAGSVSSNTRSIDDGTYDAYNNRVGALSGPSTYLTITLPGYYQSNDPASADYRKVNTLVSTGRAVRYGSASAVAADVTVQYRKAYDLRYSSECYLRREAGVDRVIADHAEAMDIDLVAQADGSFMINAWFTPTFSNARNRSTARITSSDAIMLRNARKD